MKNNIAGRILHLSFYFLVILFLYSLFKRYIFGLGAITNLSDDIPWGIWKGLNIFGGVALASGGFVATSLAYIFNIKEFKKVVRPLILISFLGYLLVILTLLIDDGRPWNIIMPLIFWNTKSVMWEVSWCVATYTLVLFLEFLPLIFEKLGSPIMIKFWGYITPILVFVGAILSTLHQSSLGTLLVIAPQKIHPFWYSKMLPLLFFLSAVSLGLAATNLVVIFFRNEIGETESSTLSFKISNLFTAIFLIYLIVRSVDVVFRNRFGEIFSFNRDSLFLLSEVFLLGLFPLTAIFVKRRESESKIFMLSNFLIILGVVFNRLNSSVIAYQLINKADYFPHFFEIVVSLSIFSISAYLFNLAVKKLPVFS